MKKRAIFPGSFDPFTVGHYDIVKRGLELFDEIIIGIGRNSTKRETFPIREREEAIKKIFADEQPDVVLPDFVYYNPNGGRYYHAAEDCASVSPQYLPLTPISWEQLNEDEYRRLLPCTVCNPPDRRVMQTTDEN